MERDDLVADAGGIADALSRLGRLSSHVGAHASRHGSDRATYILLSLLEAEGPQRAGTIAERMHSDPSTISRHVAQLVGDGLVERTTDPEDRRATLLVASERGVRHLEVMRGRRNEAIARLLRGWDPADRQALVRLLDRFVTDYEQHLPELLAVLTGPTGPVPGGEN